MVGKLIGKCGYRCDLCAARSKDPQIRKKLVDGWRKYLGHTNYTVENVQCEGCQGKGKLADKKCPIRPCAINKEVENCAFCDEYPCEVLKDFAARREDFLKRFPDISEEDYNLCLRQFESIPELIALRKAMGEDPYFE